MRQFLYKTLIVIIGIVLVYEFTIGKQIAQFKERTNILSEYGFPGEGCLLALAPNLYLKSSAFFLDGISNHIL